MSDDHQENGTANGDVPEIELIIKVENKMQFAIQAKRFFFKLLEKNFKGICIQMKMHNCVARAVYKQQQYILYVILQLSYMVLLF